MDNGSREFFLGGSDLEMATIRDLLRECVGRARVHDRSLTWGAKASAYRLEIAAALTAGNTPVLVELNDDMGETDRSRLIWVDHHGERAGADQTTSLHQVFELLGLPANRWTRWHELVAANDRGHISAMSAMGANQEEIRRVRAADRAAQGVTPDQERAAEAAARSARTLADGRLTVIDLPHNRTSPAGDLMEPALGGPGYKNLLILCPNETNFFGSGALVYALNEQFPGGWYGGALPVYGFWGRHGRSEEAEAVLRDRLTADPYETNDEPT